MEQNSCSLFSEEVTNEKVARSNQRRKAIILPFKKGQEIVQTANRLLEEEQKTKHNKYEQELSKA